jgi:hypothetical protein
MDAWSATGPPSDGTWSSGGSRSTSRHQRLFRLAYLLTGSTSNAEGRGRQLSKTYVHWGRIATMENPTAYVPRTLVPTMISHGGSADGDELREGLVGTHARLPGTPYNPVDHHRLSRFPA